MGMMGCWLRSRTCFRPHLVSAVEYLRSGRDELVVGDRRSRPRVTLDHDRLPESDEFVHAGRRDGDSVFVVLDFAGDADFHGARLSTGGPGTTLCPGTAPV